MSIIADIAVLLVTEIDDQIVPLVNKTIWVPAMDAWGEVVALNRRYVEGEHRLDMTDAMAKMLRVDKADNERFSVNYSGLIVDKMVNRMKIEKILTADGGETGQEWINNVLLESNFDEIQIDINSDTLSDGDTFAIISAPNVEINKDYVTYLPELAYDGVVGVIPVYDRLNEPMVAAVKIWYEAQFEGRRVNIYFPDRTDKYVEMAEDDDGISDSDEESSSLKLIETGKPEWVGNNGEPLGVPFGHYRNRKRTGRATGRSEPAKVRSLQDVLNKTFMSTTITSENSSFQRLFAKGFIPDSDMSPGTVITAVEKTADGQTKAGISSDKELDLTAIPAGELSPLIEMIVTTVDLLSQVSETPLPLASGNASGESLKQRDIGLTGKVKTTEVKIGGVWEALLRQSVAIQQRFGRVSVPDMRMFNVVWADPEIRNKTEWIDNAVKVANWLDIETFLGVVEPVLPFSADDIPDIIKAKADETRAIIRQVTETNPRNTPPANNGSNAGGVDENETNPELDEIANILGG